MPGGGEEIGKAVAHVRPLVPAHAKDIGRLIERIEAGGEFEVVADRGEQGSFTVRVKKPQG